LKERKRANKMGKNHLKRLNAPKKWRIKRKGLKFITRPSPGPHNINASMPLNIIIRDMLKYASTAREVRNILQNKNVLVNGIKRKEPNFPVGLFDVIEIVETKEYFRFIIDQKGKLNLVATEKADAELRACKITGKTKLKGKTQLNLSDGCNILVEKDDYSTYETLFLTIPKKEIKKRIKFSKGALVYLTGGKNIGQIGTIEDIKGNMVFYKTENGVFETLKDYAFIIGEEKPLIKI